MTTLRAAQQLPADILRLIFSYALDFDPQERAHGGRLITWDSNESAKKIMLVCKAWVDCSRSILYDSVLVEGKDAAASFMETLRRRPQLATIVKSLVVGLGTKHEASREDVGQAADSPRVVEVIRACPSLKKLQVRPLHASCRPQLLDAITSTRLSTLVCVPRLDNPDADWSRGTFNAADIKALALPTLTSLELDFDAPDNFDPLDPSATSFPPLVLREIRIDVAIRDSILCGLLRAAGPTLEVLDYYTENEHDVASVSHALLASSETMRRLSFICNPSLDQVRDTSKHVPLLDRVLPRLSNLEEAKATATEVSPRILRLLPASLRVLRIWGFSERPLFRPSEELLDALRDPALDFQLRELYVHDSQETWSVASVDSMTQACAARGITFVFARDSESDRSTGSSSRGSGSRSASYLRLSTGTNSGRSSSRSAQVQANEGRA